MIISDDVGHRPVFSKRENLDHAIKLWFSGKSLRFIADTFDVSPKAVRYQLNKEGVVGKNTKKVV